jgi:hypothetical protein
MATGMEMLITTLIKSLKLEPEVDKIRQAVDGGLIDKFNNALDKVNSFDERLGRIEQALGIEHGRVPAGSGSDDVEREPRLNRDATPQLAIGSNRGRS